jgi:hypothetical protein
MGQKVLSAVTIEAETRSPVCSASANRPASIRFRPWPMIARPRARSPRQMTCNQPR